MDTQAAFHAGEQALQARSGVRERLEAIGANLIRTHMPEQHRSFFGQLPTLLLAAQDDQGQPWATLLHGAPGFIASPDDQILRIGALPAPADPVAPWLTAGAAVGLLGLQPHTRRRNRANGRVRTLHPGGFEVQVTQSFGNCPKYIHAREPERLALPPPVPAATRLHAGVDDAAARALLRRADTLFIASASSMRPGSARAEGVDVSHRGGRAGFIALHERAGGVRLLLPDYPGNLFFNTLGNLLAWPRAGLLVPDYEGGGLLQLAAEASLGGDDDPALADFPGAQRLLRLDVLGGWWRPSALPLRWSAPEAPVQFETVAPGRV